MDFKNYTGADYQAVCDFLIALNRRDRSHINWNWARFEWMEQHPEFDRSTAGAIGLWSDGGRIVGAAIDDMYFGEAFCGVLPEYAALYPEVLAYAWEHLRDDAGLGVAICDDNADEIASALRAGFHRAEQTETVMSLPLDRMLPDELPEGLHVQELDPAREPVAFQWLLWQGFDHGTDRAQFEREDVIVPQVRPHLDPSLSLAAVNAAGEPVAYCCLWVGEGTDYAYIEPVCTVPAYRGRGVGKALVRLALNRARALGAAKAYVISDQAFYQRLGFSEEYHYTFYFKHQGEHHETIDP